MTVKRVYEPPVPADGARFLVERLWLRGMKSACRHGDVTLLYSARDAEHNNAIALQEYLKGLRARGSGTTGTKRRNAKRQA